MMVMPGNGAPRRVPRYPVLRVTRQYDGLFWTDASRWVVMLCVLAGCGVDSKRHDVPAFVVIDSAGILISVTRGREAREPNGATAPTESDFK